MDSSKKFGLIISNRNFCVLYYPVRTEIDPEVLPFKLPANRVVVPTSTATDPKLFASRIKEEFDNLNGIILVPGRRFDKFGGRHGKGWGWYDRFLSVAPIEWIRIGICSQSEFSGTKLILQEWDEVMDWVVVKSGDSYTLHETNARKPK